MNCESGGISDSVVSPSRMERIDLLQTLILVILAGTTPLWGQTLSQQKTCEEQAYVRFHREFESHFDTTKYVSHFDPKANVCYVMMVGSGHPSGSGNQEKSYVVIHIKDAFEGTQYGEYWAEIGQGLGIADCWVKPHDRPDTRITCDSKADEFAAATQFYGLARKYFGLKL